MGGVGLVVINNDDFFLHCLLIANIIPVQIAFSKYSFLLEGLVKVFSISILIKHNKCYICLHINSCLLTDLSYFLILDFYLLL